VSAWTDVEASFVASEVFQVRLVGADWGGVARATFIPSIPHTRDEWSTLVAILGTTISPYLFFWQASEEVEEEKSAGQSMLAQGRGATLKELELRNIDVGVGAFFSNMVMFFIILTTATTLNRHGITRLSISVMGMLRQLTRLPTS
jgi:Mn2+/Fe2+ NRAMP family transporter